MPVKKQKQIDTDINLNILHTIRAILIHAWAQFTSQNLTITLKKQTLHNLLHTRTEELG
jgi:hypothetical protein